MLQKIQILSRNLWVLAGSYLALLLNFAFPVVRTTQPWSDYFIFAILISATLGMLVAELFRRKGFLKWIGLTLTLPFILFSSLQVLGSITCGAMVLQDNGVDYSFERITVVPYKGTNIVGYRTNGGALTDFGMVIRHEGEPIPGLLIVRDLFDRYHAAGAEINIDDSGYIDIRMGWDDWNSQPNHIRLKLRRFVYF